MIDFFEFLNTCSIGRTILYLIFIIVGAFIVFAGVADIIKRIIGETNNHYYHANEEDVVDDEENNE
jgi:TRAP-type mannitol/chloroaromatic compound transport system permease small subunit